MKLIQSTFLEIILNPVVSSVILIFISISALLSFILVFQEIKKLTTCSTNEKKIISNKEIVMLIIATSSVIYISQYLTVNGYNSNVVMAMELLSSIACGCFVFSIIIFSTRKLANRLVEYEDK